MLILSRFIGEEVVIRMPDGTEVARVMLVDTQGRKARLGFTVPKELSVHRADVDARIQAEKAGDSNGRP